MCECPLTCASFFVVRKSSYMRIIPVCGLQGNFSDSSLGLYKFMNRGCEVRKVKYRSLSLLRSTQKMLQVCTCFLKFHEKQTFQACTIESDFHLRYQTATPTHYCCEYIALVWIVMRKRYCLHSLRNFRIASRRSATLAACKS